MHKIGIANEFVCDLKTKVLVIDFAEPSWSF